MWLTFAIMVVKIVAHHIFQYPIELVAHTHLTKYPHEKEKNVVGIDTVEKKLESNGVEYHRRIAECLNVIPNFLRKISSLNVSRIYIEEQAWLDRRRRNFTLKTRNMTWDQYAHLWEESVFRPAAENPNWTSFEQKGAIEIHGLGPFGRMMEIFAEKFLRKGMQKSIVLMEEILKERTSNSKMAV